jgi:agmatinase
MTDNESQPKDPVDHAITASDLYGTSREHMYSGVLSFGRRRYTKDLSGADVAITGVPLDTATSNRPGARFGPRAVRAASTNLAWERHWPWPFDPFERLAVVDMGDCHFDFGHPDTIPGAIERHAQSVIDRNVGLLSIGGDHFISLPLLRAHAKKFGPLSLIHFDAHTDTWQDPDFRIDHGTMFYHAAREGIVLPEKSVQIGVRTTNDDTLGFHVIDAAAVHAHKARSVIDRVHSIVGDRPAYLTFDIDCLDPAFAPGTGTPVCGGLSSAQALEIVRGLAGISFVGMDVVEVAPAYDVGEITALAGATLAYEFLCLYASRP